MILSVEFNGYKFFNDSVLSFVADARTKLLMSNSIEIDGKNVLKTIGLYGSNNSGKTNITMLFKCIKSVLEGKDDVLFSNSLFNDKDKTYIKIVFNNNNKNGWFSYEFIYNNLKHQYEFEKLSKLVYYSSSNTYEQMIFERNHEKNIFNILGEDYSEYLGIIPSRFPLLYSIEIKTGKFESLKIYHDELIELSNSIEIISMYNIPLENTLETMRSGNDKKIKFIKEFVKSSDISINDFEYDNSLNIDINNNDINEISLEHLLEDKNNYKFMTTYGDNIKVPSIKFDSTGTKKIEALASHIYDALVYGKTLIIDELDNGLHYKISRSIVSLFNNLANKKAQLLFITHDLQLIDCKTLMRKDQIYFINRNNEGASLYWLKQATSANNGIRELGDIIKHYNRGEFGNVPNPDFISLLIGVM